MSIQIDWDDPCTALDAVRQAYLDAIAGDKADWIEFKDRRTRFSSANTDALEKLMGQLQAACDAMKAGDNKPRRYSMVGSYRS